MENVSKTMEQQLNLLLEEAEEELQQLEQDSLGYVGGNVQLRCRDRSRSRAPRVRQT